jgi:hypothetical protein
MSPGSGATTVKPSFAQNRMTSSTGASPRNRTSASVNDSSYTPPSKPMPACSRTVLWMPSAPTT